MKLRPRGTYVQGPSGRGTVGLVTSCLFTLSICVYTAIHLNVFPRGTSWQLRYMKTVGWAMLGMFAPEFVLWRAITQWRVARKLSKERNKCLELEVPDVQTKTRTRWGLEHGFLAVMGGIVRSRHG